MPDVDLNDSFTLPLPIDRAWNLLTDLERIAPCLPGAALTEIEGEEHRGTVKVKVGPITAQFRGVARFTEKDEDAKRAVITAEGREQRGQGNANALVTAQLTSIDGPDGPGSATTVDVVTDLTISGKVAQFGRGVIADVSTKLISQFVANVEKMITEHPDAGLTPAAAESAAADESAHEAPSTGAHAAAESSASDAAASDGAAAGSKPADRGTGPELAEAIDVAAAAKRPAPTGAPSPAGSAEPAAKPAIRKIESREVEAVDLLELTGGTMAKRLAPVAAVGAVLLAVFVLFRRRKG